MEERSERGPQQDETVVEFCPCTEMYTFGDIVVDPECHIIRLGDEERVVARQTIEILAVLVRRSERTVSADILKELVWKRKIVSESTIHRAICLLRKALDDDARSPRYVKTIPKRGVRLLITPVALN